jgi:hypothetical protein
MTARIMAPAAGRRSVRAAAVVCGLLAAGVSAQVMAQVVNPGDIIIERDVTPRSAFDSVPKSQDPVLVRATTFPANSFDPAMAGVVSDTDLVNAHGSQGVANGVTGATAASLEVLTGMLSGKQTGSNVGMGAGVQAGGIGGSISSAVTGALSPLSAALGAVK